MNRLTARLILSNTNDSIGEVTIIALVAAIIMIIIVQYRIKSIIIGAQYGTLESHGRGLSTPGATWAFSFRVCVSIYSLKLMSHRKLLTHCHTTMWITCNRKLFNRQSKFRVASRMKKKKTRCFGSLLFLTMCFFPLFLKLPVIRQRGCYQWSALCCTSPPCHPRLVARGS